MSEHPPPWEAYACLQERLARRCEVDGYAWGLEAALNRLLIKPHPTAEEIERIIASAGRKERNRARLRRANLPFEGRTENSYLESAFDAQQVLSEMQMRVTPNDWELLCAVGEGHRYRDIAMVEKAAPGSLRARVFRLRRSLRPTAATLLMRLTASRR